MPTLSKSTKKSKASQSIAAAKIEYAKRFPVFFIENYVQIKSGKEWVPFELWPEQKRIFPSFYSEPKIIVLKARQLGLSWYLLAIGVHGCVFQPGYEFLIFSRGETEAKEMLERIKGIYDRLPSWMQPGIKKRNTEEIQFRNGSRIRSFASTGGRSFTANLAVVDEADHLQQSQNLETLLDAVEPTVNDGGRLVLISTSNKDKPESHFKAIYRNAVEGKNAYTPLFLPWGARPTRDQDWYEEQKRDKFNNTGSLDSLYQEYPETVEQALAPRSLNKRIPFNWLQQCYVSMDAIEIPAPHFPKPPSIPKLKIYQLPFMRKKYCISGDPAEGNPTSDESSCHVIDVETGEECANLIGLFEPETFADYIADIAIWFNHASAMIERNNHGHAVLVVLRRRKIKIMQGHDGKPGWLSSPKGKAMLYARAASCFQHGEVTIHDFGTLTQLQSIEGNTLRAPEGQFDDRADSFAMACCGMIAMAGQTPAKPFVHG